MNTNQLPGTGKTAMVFFFFSPSEKSPKLQGVRGRMIQKGQRTLFMEPKLKCPCHVHSQGHPYLNGTNHHHSLRWGRGVAKGGRTPADCPVQNLLSAHLASYGEGLMKAHYRAGDVHLGCDRKISVSITTHKPFTGTGTTHFR